MVIRVSYERGTPVGTVGAAGRLARGRDTISAGLLTLPTEST